MKPFKDLAVAATLVAGVVAVASPAAAMVTTFAQYTQVSGTSSRTISWRQIGSGGVLCTIATATGSCPSNPATVVTATIDVNFSFLQGGIGTSGPISAKLIIDLVDLSNTPASTASLGGVNYIVQPGLTGTFSIIADVPFSYGGVTGTNLLSGSIKNASISGQVNSSSGSVNGSTLALADPTAVQFNSDFLDFSNTVNRDFALTLTAINPGLAKTATGPARTFRAAATGSFSSDPAPLVDGSVPEPVMWAMMVVGFGMVGNSMRIRRRAAA
jgi:hypothetical protein